MSLAQFVGRRPVTGAMFYTAVALMGVISWFFTPRELFPSISFPQLLVITRYGNAAPEEIENLVTKVIEESVGTVPNLKRVRSISKEGISLVTLEFNWGADMGFAHLAAREKLDQIKDRLPSEAEDPIINRVNPFAQPMMIYSVSGSQPMRQLTELSKQVVKQRLEKVTGVASATISGGEEREIVVQVDRQRMESQNISLTMVSDTLKDSNLNYPAGTVPGKFYEYIISTKGEFKNINEIKRMPIRVDRAEDYERTRDPEKDRDREHRAKDHRLMRLDGVAEVVDTLKEKTSFSRYNGRETISISLQKQADANTLSTAVRVRFAMEELSAVLEPKGIKLELVYDESVFIRKAINGVTLDGLVGGVLAFLVLYYFLKSWPISIIVALSIPASTLFTFTGMFLNKISINMLSLAGLGLGIGAMVDNSIVVAENITRHRLVLGKGVVQAAVEGTDEVAPSMITSALTNVAVLVPLLFAKGVAQLVFRDMFFIVACASFASVFVSITLVPLMTAHPLSFDVLRRLLGTKSAEPEPQKTNRFFGGVSRCWKWFTSGISDAALQRLLERYRHGLQWALDHPKMTTQIVLVVGVLSLGMLAVQDKVFMPKIDQGQFILKLQMPVGTRLEKTNEVALKMETILRSVPGFKESTVNVGSNNVDAVDALGNHQAQAIVNLDRHLISTDEFIDLLRAALEKEDLKGGEVQYILQDSVLSSAFETSAPVVVEIKGPDMVILKKMSEDILKDLSGIRGVFGAKTSLALPSTETRVEVDKVSAASYLLSVTEIARTALIGIKGFVSTTYKEGGQEVDVRVQLRPEDRGSLDDIRRLTIQNRDGLAIPLSELAHLRTAQGPSEIKHIDQQRAIVLSAHISKRSTRDVMSDVNVALEPYRQFTDYQVDLTGESRQMKESFGGLLIAMVLATALVYMIMAAEFESLWHPFLIMVTIPFSVVGVAISLFVTQTPISAPVFLGMILLFGSVVNYGIILIDFINQLRREGESLHSAVMNGCVTRLRPVLMSALTTILAVLPLALGLSEGGELSSPMAVVTFGGLGVSVLLSLFVVPLIYFHSERWRERHAPVLAEGEVLPENPHLGV
ncbi:MAG: efflux RND transporter permease subunit [Elusimicrobia bacterium]|jgi:HAE1 family hydrophobic/amphiphilic exporter-1|nr:efflux RND transporter permease subunit [Elusimicrobiota bacterium]